MKVALVEPKNLSHRVRGTGFYIQNLLVSLHKYYPGEDVELVQKVSNEADVVHYPFFEPFFLTLPISAKTKTVVTVHDLIPLKFPEHFPVGIRGSIKWQIQKRALKRADAIITDSENSKADIIKFAAVDKSKVHAIYLAAGEQFKKAASSKSQISSIREKYNLPEKFALYVGDVTWNKNLPRLITAAKEVNLTLVMVGQVLVKKDFDRRNPWNQDLLKVYRMTENDKRIIKLGFVNNNDLVSLYNMASFLAIPSLYEGFGLPVLEAMNCGCPVVTSRKGSLKEIGGDAVRYVDPYSVKSIADGMREVYFNAEVQKKLSEKGLKQAKKFSWKKTAKETIKIYESL